MMFIKFRGQDYFTGELRYGFYCRNNEGANIIENQHAYLVDPDSVRQLVGYDLNHREIYEGDVVADFNGKCFTAELVSVGTEGGKFPFWHNFDELSYKCAYKESGVRG